jgi:hypothetical protein
LQLRCHYELGHGGPCSFKKYENQFRIMSSCSLADYQKWKLEQRDEDGVQRGFIESVLSEGSNDKNKSK